MDRLSSREGGLCCDEGFVCLPDTESSCVCCITDENGTGSTVSLSSVQMRDESYGEEEQRAMVISHGFEGAETTKGWPSVFLVGSHDAEFPVEDLDSTLGESVPDQRDWRDYMIGKLSHRSVRIVDPRCTGGHELSSVCMKYVQWELRWLEKADVIAMCLRAPLKVAAIDMIQLGLCARSRKLILCCSSEFTDRADVESVCLEYGVPLVGSVEELSLKVRERLLSIDYERLHGEVDELLLSKEKGVIAAKEVSFYYCQVFPFPSGCY